MCNQTTSGRLPKCTRSMFPFILLLVLALSGALARPASAEDPLDGAIGHDWGFAAQQLDRTAKSIAIDRYPRQTTSTGEWETTGASAWTSGFFPGALWLMFERTGDSRWRTRAEDWTKGIAGQRGRTDTHDLGFMFLSSYGNGYRLTSNDSYRQILVEAAGSLAKRYDPDVRCIRSWGAIDDTSKFEVIIDNLVNLELLLWGAGHGGNSAWRTMAVNHGLRCGIQDFMRADGSTYHRVIYDPITGALKSRGTVQGACDACTWSRGQAWAIHGFTMLYRETGDTRFLDAARKTADYFIGHLPADKVPYWDFSKSGSEPRDSSAASIAAAGLLELSQRETDATRKQTYLSAARDILASLSSPAYLAEGTKYWSILMHGTRNKPAGSYDTGLIFGDYYMLQALLRYPIAPPAPDTTPPSVTSNSPSAGATGVALTTNVIATFSEAVTGVSSSTFRLTPPGGVPIAATVIYDAGSKAATLDPSADLAASTIYTVSLNGAIADSAGNSLAPTSWSFTTTAAPPPGGTYTFGPAADAFVSQASPTTPYATNSQVQAVGGSSSAKQAFLRFNVGGLPSGASIASAKLRLVVVNDSTSGGIFNRTTNTSWPETITWNTRPAIDGPTLAMLGAVALNQVVEVDVTAVVDGNDAYSFAISMPSANTNTVGYASRENSTAASRPQLVITTR